MKTTIVVKFLGQSIGYATLYNSVSSLWWSSKSFQLMNVENGYFLVKFRSKEDYEKMLFQGPWIVFGLPGHLYNKKILEVIGGMIERSFEYKSLSTICFSCERYDYVKDLCSFSAGSKKNVGENKGSVVIEPMTGGLVKEATKFGPWMIVERWSRWNLKDSHKLTARISSGDENGTRLKALASANSQCGEKRYND
ncbi:hypothetical protein GOBAR_AA24492 [Gossypium barbadense]|uniref:DUF4283 domain-containing protein n=1 Tax=Gossypium barbadense TaxID=3634 RepID=A0A2P5WYL4_GOSBA|nr:hypothetical protein GOBAR_AA24492 [Gossypium barbadense]